MPKSCLFQERLFDLWCQKKMAPFYILTAPNSLSDPKAYLQIWTQQWLLKIFEYHKNKVAPQIDSEQIKRRLSHPDFSIIAPSAPTKNYTLDHPEIVSWLETSEYRPIEFNYRLIVIEEAFLLSETIQNKWLKRLEEPAPQTVVIMLRSRPVPLLATIESRALKLTLPPQKSEELTLALTKLKQAPDLICALEQLANNDSIALWPSREEVPVLIECFKQKKWHLLTETFGRFEGLEGRLLKFILDYESTSPQGHKRKQQLLNNMRWFEQAKTMNNAKSERWVSLLSQYLSAP